MKDERHIFFLLCSWYGNYEKSEMQWKREYKNVVVHGLGFGFADMRPNKSLSLSPY
jgi:hypothetical protein